MKTFLTLFFALAVSAHAQVQPWSLGWTLDYKKPVIAIDMAYGEVRQLGTSTMTLSHNGNAGFQNRYLAYDGSGDFTTINALNAYVGSDASFTFLITTEATASEPSNFASTFCNIAVVRTVSTHAFIQVRTGPVFPDPANVSANQDSGGNGGGTNWARAPLNTIAVTGYTRDGVANKQGGVDNFNTLYYDDTRSGSYTEPSSGDVWTIGRGWQTGSPYGGPYYWTGRVYRFAFWNQAMTEGELRYLRDHSR